ncbi:hypothetical protein WMY93_022897 [Mugilogobius chulae]|uniref:Uncharacterized protein n=1 Tax=Mugilogobius chulae TaxID=88201 RepID=A0AAW0NF83_9GOBI
MIRRITRNEQPLRDALTLHDPTAAELDKLKKLETILEHCRYISDLLVGEKFVSCSVVLPALCHLSRVMEASEEDPAYIVKFKENFAADMNNRKEKTNITWLKIATALDPRVKDLKCLSRQERPATLHDDVSNRRQYFRIRSGSSKLCFSRFYEVVSGPKIEGQMQGSEGFQLPRHSTQTTVVLWEDSRLIVNADVRNTMKMDTTDQLKSDQELPGTDAAEAGDTGSGQCKKCGSLPFTNKDDDRGRIETQLKCGGERVTKSQIKNFLIHYDIKKLHQELKACFVLMCLWSRPELDVYNHLDLQGISRTLLL